MNNFKKGHQSKYLLQGFSLLEIVMVLGMMAVIVTWITVSVATVQTEEQLRRASGAIVTMATRARNVAVRQQRPYAVTVTEQSVSMAPRYALSLADSDDSSFSNRASDRGSDSSGGSSESPLISHEDVTASKAHDEAVSLEIQRWGSDDWITMEKDVEVTFTIEPSGLVEPIGLRCSIGESWIIQRLHPLTGSVRDEEMTIMK